MKPRSPNDRRTSIRCRSRAAAGRLAGKGELDEHTPVLVEEALSALAVRPAGLYVDATYGRGGHSGRILEALGAEGRLIAIDRDPDAVAAGRVRFAHEPRLRLVQGEFAQIAALVRAQGLGTSCD